MVQRLRVDANNSSEKSELKKPYEHLKRLRMSVTDETRKRPNAKYLESVANQSWLTCAKTRPTPGVLTQRATMMSWRTHVSREGSS